MYYSRKNDKNDKKNPNISETLIVSVVIAVISVVIIGVYGADYFKNQTALKLKNMYSLLSTAIDTSISNNGTPDKWDIEPGLSERASYDFFSDYIKPFLPVARDCKNSTKGICNFSFKELSGKPQSLSPKWVRFFVSDGNFIALQTYSDDFYKVVYFYVDTNGKRDLNASGRDVFMFVYWIKNRDNHLVEGKLLPYGFEYMKKEIISKDKDGCNKTATGNYCGALIMKDDWRIQKGYPWAQARYTIKN